MLTSEVIDAVAGEIVERMKVEGKHARLGPDDADMRSVCAASDGMENWIQANEIYLRLHWLLGSGQVQAAIAFVTFSSFYLGYHCGLRVRESEALEHALGLDRAADGVND